MSDAGQLPSLSADRIQQILAQQQQKKGKAAAAAAATPATAKPQSRRFLKGPKATVQSFTKGIRNRLAARNRPCPQELTILGEFVRMEGDIETTHGRVAFEREYYPKDSALSDDQYKEELADARAVFCAAFKPGSTFDVEDPKYLKDDKSAEKLRKGLLRRFLELRAQLLEMNAKNPDGQLEEKKEMYGHLLRLKKVIEALEGNRRAGHTMNSYEPFTKTTSADLEDEENLKRLVEKFMFLVVQARTPKPEFRELQGDVNNPAELVNLVNSVSIDGVDLKNLEELPEAFKKWFGCVEATDVEYEELREDLRGLFEEILNKAIDDLSSNENAKDFFGKLLGQFNENEKNNNGDTPRGQYEYLVDNMFQIIVNISKKAIENAGAGVGVLDPNRVDEQLAILNGQIESANAQLAECQAQLAEARAAAAGNPAAAPADTAPLEETIQALLKQIETITTEINKLQDKGEELDENVANRDAKLNAYTRVLENFRDRMLEMRKTIIGKNEELATLNATLEANSAKLSASAAQLAALQAQLTTITDEKGDLTTANTAAAADLQALRAKHTTDLANKEAELQKIIAGLKTEHAKDLAALWETIRKRGEEIDTTAETLRTLESKRTKLLTSIGDIERMLVSIEAKLALDILKSEEKDIRLKKVEYEELKKQLEKDKTDIEDKIKEMEADLKAKEDADKKAMEDLQNELTKTQKDLEATKQDFEAQKAAAAAAHAAYIMKLTTEFDAKKEELTEKLDAEKAAALAAAAAHAAEKAALEAEIAKGQADLEAQAKTFAEDYARLNATYNENLAKKEAEITKQTNEKNALKVKLAAKEDELTRLNADKTEKANALDAVRSELTAAQAEVTRLGREGEEKEAKITRLTAALADAEAKLQAANQAAADCNATLTALQGEMTALQGSLDRAKEEREDLSKAKNKAEDEYKKTVDKLQAELGESNGEVARLRAEIADAREEIHSLKQGSPAISVVPPNQTTAKRDNLLNQVQDLVGKIRSGQVPRQVPASLDRLSGRLQLYARENESISDVCALNLIISTFAELLFGNPITPEKIAFGRAIAQELSTFLAGKRNVGQIVVDYVESLRTFETQPYTQPQRSPDVAALLGQFASLRNLDDLETKAKKYFDAAFPEFKRLSGETIQPESISYAMEFAIFILLSRKYMERIQKTLTSENCIVKPTQLQAPALPAAPEPPRLTDGSELDAVIGEPQAQQPEPQPDEQDDYALLGASRDQPLGQIARMFQYRGYQLLRAGKTVELDRLKKAYQRVRAEKLGRDVEELPDLSQRRLKSITQRNIAASKNPQAVKRNLTRRQGARMFNQGAPPPVAIPGQVSKKTARLQRQGYTTRSRDGSAPQQP